MEKPPSGPDGGFFVSYCVEFVLVCVKGKRVNARRVGDEIVRDYRHDSFSSF